MIIDIYPSKFEDTSWMIKTLSTSTSHVLPPAGRQALGLECGQEGRASNFD
jgi:hypothetical protein